MTKTPVRPDRVGRRAAARLLLASALALAIAGCAGGNEASPPGSASPSAPPGSPSASGVPSASGQASATASAPPPATASTVPSPSAVPTATPGDTPLPTPVPSGSPTSFSVTLPGGEDRTEPATVTVLDTTGLLEAVEAVVPDAPLEVPLLVDQGPGDQSVRVGWTMFYCQSAPTVTLERIAERLVLTLDRGAPWDCDAVGDQHALLLSVAEPLIAETIVARQMREGALEWSFGEVIHVVDRARVTLKVEESPINAAPPREEVLVEDDPDQPNTVIVSWTTRCETESTVYIEAGGPALDLRIEVLDASSCRTDEAHALRIAFSGPVEPENIVATILTMMP